MNNLEIKKPIISHTLNKSVRVLVTPTHSKKWKGCIYFSAYDLTGIILMYLNDIHTDFNGMIQKSAIHVFTAKDKSGVETKISEKLQLILKNNQ